MEKQEIYLTTTSISSILCRISVAGERLAGLSVNTTTIGLERSRSTPRAQGLLEDPIDRMAENMTVRSMRSIIEPMTNITNNQSGFL